MTLKILLLVAFPFTSLSFGVLPLRSLKSDRVASCFAKKTDNDVDPEDSAAENVMDSARRNVLIQLPLATSAAAWVSHVPSVWAADTTFGSTSEHPVAILGGGGRTGMEVAKTLAQQGIYAVTMTRSGRNPFQVVKLPEDIKPYVTHYEGQVNVCQAENLLQALQSVQPSAIVFCASASKQGGNAFEVDDVGVGNAAEVARDLNSRFILVSALAVDRPDSKSYKITNTLGGNLDGIMDAKRQGEEKVRSAMAKTKDYVIVRPGPLLNGKSLKGAADIELNQGDEVGGGISREELAGVVVGALQSGKRGATVEAYRKSTATKLQPEFNLPSGRESTSDTYVGLFDHIKEGI